MAEPGDGDEAVPTLHTIRNVARELGVTSRTLRFYEDKGLLEPQRAGAIRVYTRREVGRLRLILRGKRLGFSIREIKEFLDLYDADPQHLEQMRRLAARVAERLVELERQRVAIDETVAELRRIEQEARARIAAVAGDADRG